MIKTGYISFITQTGGGYDSDGNPIVPVTTISAYIECNLKTVKKEYKTFIDGQYKQAAYSVYIDSASIGDLNVTRSYFISTDVPGVDVPEGYVPTANDNIFVDGTTVVTIDINAVKQANLKDNNANDLGTFQIQSIEYLNLTKRVKIVM